MPPLTQMPPTTPATAARWAHGNGDVDERNDIARVGSAVDGLALAPPGLRRGRARCRHGRALLCPRLQRAGPRWVARSSSAFDRDRDTRAWAGASSRSSRDAHAARPLGLRSVNTGNGDPKLAAEQRARVLIDRQLADAGWSVQDKKEPEPVRQRWRRLPRGRHEGRPRSRSTTCSTSTGRSSGSSRPSPRAPPSQASSGSRRCTPAGSRPRPSCER
jgi:hypothetical protein